MTRHGGQATDITDCGAHAPWRAGFGALVGVFHSGQIMYITRRFLQKTAKETKVPFCSEETLRYLRFLLFNLMGYSESGLSSGSFTPGKIMREMPFFRTSS
jgi:hypothetical protein